MKNSILIIFIACLSFSSCDLFNDLFGNKDKDPVYNANIVWKSNLESNDYTSQILYGDSVLFFESAPEYFDGNASVLTMLDARTGQLIWRSKAVFSSTIFSQPLVIDRHVYVFLQPRIILCFNIETGEQTATINVDIDNKGFEFYWYFPVAHKEYIYLSLSLPRSYFVRLDSRIINQSGDYKIMQMVSPEILWEPENNNRSVVETTPVIYNNTIFTATSGFRDRPIEIAGFDLDSLEMIFHCTFGGTQDQIDYGDNLVHYDRGNGKILTNEGILYYIGDSRSAWDIASGEKLYRYVQLYSNPYSERTHSDCLQPVHYNGYIYYTNMTGYSNGGRMRNIHCIDTVTGKLVWNTIAYDSASLKTNPIIANGKLFVPQSHGFFVFDTKTGKLRGVDKTFYGSDTCRNLLYNDLLICLRKDKGYYGKLVAVNVGK